MTQKQQATDFEMLVREHQRGVWRYLRFLGADDNEVDDLVQETFLALMRSSFEYQSPAATAAYLRQVARHQLLLSRRNLGREIDTAQLSSAETVWAEVAAEDGLAGYLAALEGCLEQLSKRQRQAVNFRYRQGLSRAETADQLGLTPDGVKTLLRRIRKQLRECVERKVKPDE